MKDETWQQLDTEFAEFPFLRAPHGASIEELDAASTELGIPFPEDYRAFLHRYGGAIVGPYPIIGLRNAEIMGKESVIEVNRRYRAGQWPDIENWLIISVDHGGNPLGIAPDGRVWVTDHDFGVTDPVAENFEEFLLQLLSGRRPPIMRPE